MIDAIIPWVTRAIPSRVDIGQFRLRHIESPPFDVFRLYSSYEKRQEKPPQHAEASGSLPFGSVSDLGDSAFLRFGDGLAEIPLGGVHHSHPHRTSFGDNVQDNAAYHFVSPSMIHYRPPFSQGNKKSEPSLVEDSLVSGLYFLDTSKTSTWGGKEETKEIRSVND